MPIEKPLPLMVGDKAYYTLTSYDPVEISVDVPYTSDEDVAYGIEMAVADAGGTLKDLDDDAWVAEHFTGIANREQLAVTMRRELTEMAAQAAEQQKLNRCMLALNARLCQSIPPQHLERAREMVRMRFAQQMQAEGLTPEQFLARSGATMAQLETMFEQQARQAAESDAALSAYAHEKKLKVSEEEYPRLLGLSPDQLQTAIEEARKVGQLDEMREAALRSKAAQTMVAECSCSYNHETPEQAHARIAQMRQMRSMYDQQFGAKQAEKPAQEKDEGGKTGFKLV